MMPGLRAAVALSLALVSSMASAEPWLAPGGARLRADIQLLADAGVLRGPVTTWPVSWPDLARDINSRTVDGLDEAEAAALLRVKRLAREASSDGFSGIGIRVSASHEPTELRTFDYAPREEGELGLSASWLGDHLAVKLQGTIVADADDGKNFRADGSYLGVNIGNFMLSAGFMERWWGPGSEGSRILSTNAPFVAVMDGDLQHDETILPAMLAKVRAGADIAVGSRYGGEGSSGDGLSPLRQWGSTLATPRSRR